MLLDSLREKVIREIDREFLREVCITARWELFREYEHCVRTDWSAARKREEFGRRRGGAIERALIVACKNHGVPHGYRRLDCNGQDKLIVKSGRAIIIQESILELTGAPRYSTYKAQMAALHGVTRQLELDLGDRPNRILDWRGDFLVSLLHGLRGTQFNQADMALGALQLAIPDADYMSWATRIDLTSVAEFGRWKGDKEHGSKQTNGLQTDLVQPRLRPRIRDEEEGEE